MLPLIPADLLRAVGLVAVPAAWAVAGWPSAAVMFLVFGTQWLPRTFVAGSALDWGSQAVLLAAGWSSVIGLYHRVPGLDLAMHAGASAVIAGLVAVTVRARLARRGVEASEAVHRLGPLLCATGIASATVALGVLWEFGEWWGHTVVTEEIGVGYDDTVGDLAANVLGAGAGAVLAVRAVQSGRRP